MDILIIRIQFWYCCQQYSNSTSSHHGFQTSFLQCTTNTTTNNAAAATDPLFDARGFHCSMIIIHPVGSIVPGVYKWLKNILTNILNLLAHIWTSLYFQLHGWTVAMNRSKRFKSIQTSPYFQLQGWTVSMNSVTRFMSIWTSPNFQWQGWTVAMNRATRFKSSWTLSYFQWQGYTSLCNFEPGERGDFVDPYIIVVSVLIWASRVSPIVLSFDSKDLCELYYHTVRILLVVYLDLLPGGDRDEWIGMDVYWIWIHGIW